MTWRYRSVLLFFVFIFISIIARLFYWQVVRASELFDLGQDQYGRVIKLDPKRGQIMTSDGFAIAANKHSYLVFANPKEVKNVNSESELLANLLDTDTASISSVLSLDKFWVALKPQVDRKTKERIESLKIPGVGFQEQYVRYYPEASTAAKLLGFVGKDENGENKGYNGLEGYYDRQLRGKTGLAVQIHDALGQPILAKMNDNVGKTDGRDLILHVDRTIQFLLDKELKDGVERYEAVSGMAVVMDPKTGGILAMSSFPNFDPRNYQDYSNDLYRNPLLSDLYEPGSTFKPIVMSSAMDAGLIKPDTRCTICAGPVTIGEYDVRTWDKKYYANSTMTEVIQHSDNTGMVFVGRKLGLDRMLSYFKKFGIGETTGVDLQGEAEAPIRARDDWYQIDQATATFGQGISVTPIELITAFSAIANGGKRMEPHVVAAIQTPEGEKIEIPPKILSTPISEKTARIMTEMMVNAVDKGEAKRAKPKGYRIAGKTGTAQIAVEGHYDANTTIASFIGFAPADDPKFLMLVVYNSPKTSSFGSETAAPTFFRVAKNILSYYGIPPSE
jgi:cell division protein FtsI/penicillin-binding protein 2